MASCCISLGNLSVLPLNDTILRVKERSSTSVAFVNPSSRSFHKNSGAQEFLEVGARALSPSRTIRVHAANDTSGSDAPSSITNEEKVPGGCPGCGKAEKLAGCNGEGRIQGGIGAIPGFGWLPIKAYRPCPAFIETGGRYRRTGQSLEEVAFGRKGAGDDLNVSERLKKR